MYKILVLGGEGMLGHMVKRVLSRKENLIVNSTHHEELTGSLFFNINDGIAGLRDIMVEQESFDYIINCIGILSSSVNENDPKSVHCAIIVNAVFPHELAILAQEVNARVIQISTDAVFAEDAGVCLEDTPCNCNDIYGKTKSLGEVNLPNYLNLRCSIIGPSPYSYKGLLHWFLSQPKGFTINGYTDQNWTGLTTLQFAKLCHLLIIDNYFDLVRREAPTHHFCPNQTISKYELLLLFKDNFRIDLSVKPKTSRKNAVSRTLDTNYKSIEKIFGYNISMDQAISELAIEMKDQK
jgi:dTDP-4-dehydrorhamnose reductase